MVLDEIDYERLGRAVVAYCTKYNIRVEDFLPILNDQPTFRSLGREKIEL